MVRLNTAKGFTYTPPFPHATYTSRYMPHATQRSPLSDHLANRRLLSRTQSTARVKSAQLWGKGKEDLEKQLEELKTELNQLRVQKIVSGASSKVTRMYVQTAGGEKTTRC
ncbi:60S ribosomal protein L35 [Ascosphaera acerosa]|nr:60S ribosomal protein L35 [Ascosphaera acerosa]